MNRNRLTQLSPSQEWAYQQIVDLIAAIRARGGNGRTTILRNLATHLGAHLVTLGDVFQKTSGFHPLQVEEGIIESLLEPLGKHQLVIMDDLHVITDIFNNCHVCARPRIQMPAQTRTSMPTMLQAPMPALVTTDHKSTRPTGSAEVGLSPVPVGLSVEVTASPRNRRRGCARQSARVAAHAGDASDAP